MDYTACLYCGQLFKGSKFGRKKLYCSDQCRYRYQDQHKPKKEYSVCVVCGGKIDHSHKTYCSIECQYPKRPCEYCGKIFQPTTYGKSCCSDKCIKSLTDKKKREGQLSKTCEMCGSTFSAIRDKAHQKYCSDKCRERADGQRKRETGAAQKRAAIYRGKKHYTEVKGETVVPEEIFERDNWICQLCYQPVDKELQYPDPMYKTLDHIIPLSKGGDHTKDNLQLAHFSCNSQKNSSTDW